jgi:hypothetical protein
MRFPLLFLFSINGTPILSYPTVCLMSHQFLKYTHTQTRILLELRIKHKEIMEHNNPVTQKAVRETEIQIILQTCITSKTNTSPITNKQFQYYMSHLRILK